MPGKSGRSGDRRTETAIPEFAGQKRPFRKHRQIHTCSPLLSHAETFSSAHEHLICRTRKPFLSHTETFSVAHGNLFCRTRKHTKEVRMALRIHVPAMFQTFFYIFTFLKGGFYAF